ncbi:MAG: transglutaminase domain-containing protein, partial [Oscillospiraceae bacterium]|nr:transglutaminase domain-containing protein [Oscillospiraceae bacterium]
TAFPLTAGSGTYAANIFENVSGTSYALALGTSFSAKLSSSLAPYLYPNQYVNYTAQSKAIAKGEELAAKASTKIGVVQEVYNYLISNVVYDHQKAATVKSGYTPNVDSTLATKTGICFDYAALMATMLRTQDIPTRLEVGYVSGGIYHAWVSVYIPEQGWINGLIKFDGSNWSMMDPTFAASSAVPQSYTTASYSYSVKYLY